LGIQRDGEPAVGLVAEDEAIEAAGTLVVVEEAKPPICDSKRNNNRGAIGPNDAGLDPSPVPGFTPEQVQRILSLIDNQNTGNEKLQGRFEWLYRLYDTGASCHMTGHFEISKNVKKIDPITVGLLDGNEATANKIGNVRLGPKMVLQGVPFVPKLKCNLISIWKLSKDSNYIVTFY